MKHRWANLTLNVILLNFLAHATTGNAEEATVKVGVYARHMASKVVYSYKVTNGFPQTIDRITIGRDSRNDDDPANDSWELVELPSDWHSRLGIPAASSSSPTGWKVSLSDPDKGDTHAIVWEVINDRSPPLLGGQSLARMSISLDQPDPSYLHSHATLHFTNRVPDTITVPIEQLDLSPPTLELSLSPSAIAFAEDRLVPINASFTVKSDDYDRLPEIKLESITASEPMEPDDVRDASYGVDDRYFKLRARHTGWGDRVYTVIYSATDASGNQTLGSATVTVQQNQSASMIP
jgi:hypothetical protein